MESSGGDCVRLSTHQFGCIVKAVQQIPLKKFVNPLMIGPGDFASGWVQRGAILFSFFLNKTQPLSSTIKNFMNFDPLLFEK